MKDSRIAVELNSVSIAHYLQEHFQKFGFTNAEIVTINHIKQHNTCVNNINSSDNDKNLHRYLANMKLGHLFTGSTLTNPKSS
jgi:histidyl-tRNA synthetase